MGGTTSFVLLISNETRLCKSSLHMAELQGMLTFFFFMAWSYAPCKARFFSLTVMFNFPSSSNSSTCRWMAARNVAEEQVSKEPGRWQGTSAFPVLTSLSSSFRALGSLFILWASRRNFLSFLFLAISFALCTIHTRRQCAIRILKSSWTEFH